MDRRTDGGDCNIPYAILKKRGDNDGFEFQLICIGKGIIFLYFFSIHRKNDYNLFLVIR